MSESTLFLIGLATFVVMMVVEKLSPGRTYPEKRLWWLKGLGFFFATSLTGMLASTAFGRVLPAPRVDLSSLPILLQGLLCHWALTFVQYFLHRGEHTFLPLWRVHQIHHAPVRMDIGGATLFHPADVALNVIVFLLPLALLRVTPSAVILYSLLTQFYSYFQHWNVKTPRLLGYFIQRPESHFVHHQREIHGKNYSDLPLWDILFGTFVNPEKYREAEVGFAPPTDTSYLRMLLFQEAQALLPEKARATTPTIS